MSETKKPVRCGCGGEAIAYIESMDGGFWHRINVSCSKCGIRTPKYDTEAEAIEAWNRAMGERTAKVVEHDASVTDTDGYIYHRMEYLCDSCHKKVIGGDDYCSHCGARLEWK